MEPIITAGFVWSLAKPILTKYTENYATKYGENRITSLLNNGAKNIYKRITDRIDEPTNHHIQRGIRKSYLQATIMAVDFVLKDFNALNILNKDKKKLNKIETYLYKEIEDTTKDGKYLPNTVLDDKYREILFPKEGSKEKMPELIAHLKLAIISELGKRNYTVPDKLKEVINSGWEADNKHHDFYALIAAFFTQELKDNPNISVYLQTEYLDHITEDTKELKIEVGDIKIQLDKHYETYKAILPKLDELLSGQQEIKKEIAGLRADVIQKIDKAISQKHIGSFSEVTVSTEYQNKIKVIESFDVEIESIQSQVSDLEKVVKKDQAMKANLQPTIDHLNKQLFEQFEAKKKEEDALNEFITQIINLAEKLNQTKAFDSVRLEKARALFIAGKFDEIDDVLNEAEIDIDIEAYGAEGRILANEITIKAQAMVVNKAEGWFEEADRLYAKAMWILENYDTTYNYALFFDNHIQYDRAAEVYEKALTYVCNEIEKATVLHNLAIVLRRINKYAESEKSILEALSIRRQLAEANPQKYLIDLAKTLDHLGALYVAKIEYDAAEKLILEALTIRRKLAETDSEKHLPDLAKTMDFFAIVHYYKKDYNLAKKYFLESLTIKRQLAESNPKNHLSNFALTLGDIAVTLRAKKEYEAAKKYFLEGLTIFRKLATVNPYSYLGFLAIKLSNFGSLQHDIKDFTAAEENHLEALAIRRELCEINPQAYLFHVANTLYYLAILQRDKNEFDAAEKNFLEAIAINRKLAKVNPKTYELELAFVLIELTILQCSKGEFEIAEKSILEALQIIRPLVKSHPETYLPDLAKTLYNLGSLQRDKNEFEQAQQSFNEALSIQRVLVKRHPLTYLPELAETLSGLGALQQKKNEIEQAQQSYNEALSIQRTLVETHQQAHLPFLAEILNGLGNLQIDKNEIEHAQQSFNEALSIRKLLAEKHPEFYLPELAETLNSLGNLHRDKNEIKQAQQSYNEALSIQRALVQTHQQAHSPFLAEILSNLGNLQMDKNEIEQAQQSLNEALNIRKPLAKKHPEFCLPALVDTQISFGQFYAKSVKDKEKSIHYINEAIGNLQTFKQLPCIQHKLHKANKVLENWGVSYVMLPKVNGEAQAIGSNGKLIEMQMLLQTRNLTTKILNGFQKEDKFVDMIRSYIIENIEKPNLTSESISHHFGMSRMQLHRKLKALIQCTLADYVRSIRLEAATQLLQTEDLTISQIAYQTGFSSPSHFGRAFKKVYGKTPSEVSNS